MLTVPDQERTDSLLGKPAGALVLRVRGTRRNGQEVRLAGSRCTVGSAPGSTLRLVAAGVGPRHCLLLRGARGTIVRRLGADTRLNGRAFDDAPLVNGDVLGIGPLEFEVVSAAATAAICSADDGATVADHSLAELERCCDLLEAERRQWEDEARQAGQQRDSLQTELESERAKKQVELEAASRELAAAREQFDHSRQIWQRRQLGAERELAERESRSALQAVEQTEQAIALAAQQREWAVRQETWTVREEALCTREADLESLAAKLEASAAELDEQRTGLETERAALAELRSGLEAELRQAAEQRRVLDESALQLQKGRAALVDERQRLTTQREQFAEQQLAWDEEHQAQLEVDSPVGD